MSPIPWPSQNWAVTGHEIPKQAQPLHCWAVTRISHELWAWTGHIISIASLRACHQNCCHLYDRRGHNKTGHNKFFLGPSRSPTFCFVHRAFAIILLDIYIYRMGQTILDDATNSTLQCVQPSRVANICVMHNICTKGPPCPSQICIQVIYQKSEWLYTLYWYAICMQLAVGCVWNMHNSEESLYYRDGHHWPWKPTMLQMKSKYAIVNETHK